jgi:hypothetical protein
MRPYTSAFHRTVQNFRGSTVSYRLPDSDSIFDLLVWRAFLCLLAFHEERFARHLDTFRPVVATFKIEYDASLTGLGILISTRRTAQDSWQLKYHFSLDFPFDVEHDSSYQNTCEFLAVVSALVILVRYGHSDFSFDLYGDSISSLQWCRDERTKSTLARQAMFGFSLLSLFADATLATTIHVPGKENVLCDSLSRGKNGIQLGLDPSTGVDLPTTADVHEFLLIANPLLTYHTQAEQEKGLRLLIAFLVKLRSNLRSRKSSDK